VSGLEFLAALGLYEVPIFGVVITGSRGVLLMGWKCTPQTLNFIIDRNLASFDIKEPLGAFHFAVIVNRIYRQAQ
ncbi:hypothetical protein BDN70DRAFT_765039, partial [Pholiota conissans]